MHRDRDRVNILVVDDQPSKLLSYEVILEELGENLIKASSGRQALEQLLRTKSPSSLSTSRCPSWTDLSWPQ